MTHTNQIKRKNEKKRTTTTNKQHAYTHENIQNKKQNKQDTQQHKNKIQTT